MDREPNTQYILSLSYGKDSLACLGAIKKLGLPLDRIVHAEVWATDTIPADLPPMVEFKKKADAIIKERYGIEVEHICALKTRGSEEGNLHTRTYSTKDLKRGNTMEKFTDSHIRSERGAKNSSMRTARLTYEDVFYRIFDRGKRRAHIYGFPMIRGPWCTSTLKTRVIEKVTCSQTVHVERERERAARGAVSRHCLRRERANSAS